jgi:hypothetical protein
MEFNLMKNTWCDQSAELSGPFRAVSYCAGFPWVDTHGYSRCSPSVNAAFVNGSSQRGQTALLEEAADLSAKRTNVNSRGRKPTEHRQNIPGPEGTRLY